MVERIKSIALALLVAFSMLQTYWLVYSTPQFEQASKNDYVVTEEAQNRLELAQLVQPHHMVLHFGEKQHTMIDRANPMYATIMQTLKKLTFDGLEKTSFKMVDVMRWREQLVGVDVRYATPLSLEVWQQLYTVSGEEQANAPFFDGMYATITPLAQSVEVYLLAEKEDLVYRFASVNLLAITVQQWLDGGADEPKYTYWNDQGLIPVEPLRMNGYEVKFEQTPTAPLWRRLFIDPNITRNLTERDGTKIYTDGKRGLQIKENSSYMLYSDPVAQLAQKSSVKDGLLTGIQFINTHGGWSGAYALQRLRVDAVAGEQLFDFHLRYANVTVLDLQNAWFGKKRLKMKNGVVASFQRPLLELQAKPEKTFVRLLIGGDQLAERLQSLEQDWSSVEPVLESVMDGDAVKLTPVWAVTMVNGETKLIR